MESFEGPLGDRSGARDAAEDTGGTSPRPRPPGAGSESDETTAPFKAPVISLPKGGGAVRGMGEKFSVNATTGSATLTVPLPLSPGRSGFTPQLSLAYDTGGGNGPFGMGWGLGLPAVVRKTDKGVPTYDDADESDVFVLSDAEDLVSQLAPDGRPLRRLRTVAGVTYEVTRYRPRIEGLYARIERWTARPSGETHWRTISSANVTTLYGRDANARIADPADPVGRVFSWLICESYDDKGNTIAYRYAEEDSTGVDLSAPHELHRTPEDRSANRHLKSVRYGNRASRLAPSPEPAADGADWLFELVLDYGEHHPTHPRSDDSGAWLCRDDPFSTYRSGFEIRTYRLCQRLLMFHHFPDEPGVGRDCLVRSLRLTYRGSRGDPGGRRRGEPTGAFLAEITRSGHRTGPEGPVTRSLPPLELTYSTPTPDHRIRELDRVSLEHLPAGIDGTLYQWADLDGEAVSGVVTAQAGALLYKPNEGDGRLGPQRQPTAQPALPLGGGRGQLLDLAGDGRLDLVDLGGPAPGFYERDDDGGWSTHRPFTSLPVLDWNDPNLRFADVDGDGLADVLVTEGDDILWYPSLGEAGFGPAVRVPAGSDEDAGPRLLFADGTRSVHLADLSGDGLLDLVRVRDGEICYWPSLGRGRFGAKVVMDNAPRLDHPDRYDERRIHFADVDGTGPADLVHVGSDGVDVYTNQLGNAWSDPVRLPAFPPVGDLTPVSVVDLLGTGTACLVWSSQLPSDAGRHVRYVDLTGPKPHLLVRLANNLGAETALTYAPSTRFYLRDKAEGRPWPTRLPFPVHVVEKSETFDRINHNRLVTRYRYRDGYFDGTEREFRGFATVEQEDTEHIGALGRDSVFPTGDNESPAHHLPPVRTRSWFHTGAHLDRDRLSRLLAEQYYPPSGTDVPDALTWLLDDTPLPAGLPPDAERQACRALRGQLLRQEVYALDGTEDEPHPYTVTERNYTVRMLQAPAGRRYGVFAVDPRESVTAVCERRPADARVAHEAVLDVDPDSGTVLHSVTLAYGRGTPDRTLPAHTREVQSTTLVTETRVRVTGPVDTTSADGIDAHRVPVPYDTRTHRLHGRDTAAGIDLDRCRPRVPLDYLRHALRGPLPAGLTRTLVARHRVRFLADDLSGPLPWGVQQPLGLTHGTQRLALPDALVADVYGSRVDGTLLTATGYVHDEDGGWWAPSGTARYAPGGTADPLGFARRHFFVPRRFVDAFAAVDPAGEYGTDVEYDPYDLLTVRTTDAVGNTVTAERAGLDYRVLAPTVLTDPNGNRTAVLFDALGMVVASAVRGKPADDTGDGVDGIDPDPPPDVLAAFWNAPHEHADGFLGRATNRLVYDLEAYLRSRDDERPRPPASASLTRVRHVRDGAEELPQVTLGYSDGGGREIQRKILAEPGPDDVAPRWVGSGWTVLNNKGRPVRQYEPFFTPRHAFEFAVEQGVSPLLCYDPPGRLTATLHPNHTYEKTVIGPWQQHTWDVNDTAALPGPDGRPAGSPADDPDTARYATALPEADYLPTWYRQRIDGGLGPHERTAAERTAPHTATPLLTCLDPLGRLVLTVAHNRTPVPGAAPVDSAHRACTDLDIAGSPLAFADCVDGTPGPADGSADRTVGRYRYDLLGNRLHERSMEAGEHRRLFDVDGTPVVTWEAFDDAGAERVLTTRFDRLRRPLDALLTEGGTTTTVQRTHYGEDAPDAALANLRGRVRRIDDGAGTVTHRYDVQGNLAEASRTLVADHRVTPDWAAQPAMTAETWTTRTVFDALGRARECRHPEGSVVTYAFNRRGLLDAVTAVLAPDETSTEFVPSVEYDAKGRRTRVAHAGGATTTYTYDPHTFRLVTVRTARDGGRADVQHLMHVHDPAGNVIRIEDTAQSAVFHLNTRVEASTDYVYDALYRLIEAHGREHLAERDPKAPTGVPGAHPADRGALGRYRERYTYDTAGNLTALDHRATDPRHPGWGRTFAYEEHSPLQPPDSGLPSNRLTRSTISNGRTREESYHHDALGQLDLLPPLQVMRWDHIGQLRATATQRTGPDLVPETTFYGYDSARQRVRRVRDGQTSAGTTGRPLEERIYLGDSEVYRTYDSDGARTLERTTLHVRDGAQRIALVETRVDDGAAGDPDARTVRHQYAGHIGSVTVELDEAGEVLSYEEYHPYGTTAVAFWRGGTPAKRYRFTGKERDATGLYYYGDRYYAPWLCRWISTDPQGVSAGLNLYVFVQGNPVSFKDPDGREVEAYNIAPGRPGNQPWAWFLGVSAHRLIAYHYLGAHMNERSGIYTNYHTVAAILTAGRIGDPSRLTAAQQALKPDITNIDSREVFEIKPWNQEGLEAGRRQVSAYIDALNKGMGLPPGAKGVQKDQKGPGRYPFLTGQGVQGQLAVQFHGGRMVWRLIWKTTEDGIVQYKWQKTNKTDRDEIKEAGEGQWVDITEQDAAAHAEEVAQQIDADLGRNEKVFKLMDATNMAQTIVGEVAMAVMMANILSAQPGTGVRAPAQTPAPVPGLPRPTLPPPLPPPRPPSLPPGAPAPWQRPPVQPPTIQPRP